MVQRPALVARAPAPPGAHRPEQVAELFGADVRPVAVSSRHRGDYRRPAPPAHPPNRMRITRLPGRCPQGRRDLIDRSALRVAHRLAALLVSVGLPLDADEDENPIRLDLTRRGLALQR